MKRSKYAFTLIELLVTVSILAILAGLALTGMKAALIKAKSAKCVSNLHQMGIAITSYVAENDGYLPGPIYGAQVAWYRKWQTGKFPILLESQLGSAVTFPDYHKAAQLECPATIAASPAGNQSNNLMFYSYRTPGYLRTSEGKTILDANNQKIVPFGILDQPGLSDKPMRMVALYTVMAGAKVASGEAAPPLSQLPALRDVDQLDPLSVNGSGFNLLPLRPAHGNYRNTLYFDWHVAAEPIE